MTSFRAWRVLVAWDFTREMRRKNTLVAMGMMALVTLFVFAFAIPTSSVELDQSRAGILWTTLLLAATVGIDRAFRADGEGRLLEGLLLSPVSRPTIYHARVASTLLFVLTIAVPSFGLFMLFFNQSVSAAALGWIALTALATLFGFVTLGVLLSSLTFSVRGGDVLLRVVLFPLLVPIFATAVDATSRAFDGGAPDARHAGLILAFDLTFLGAGHLLFDHGVKDLGPQG
ncbi:MAG: heme exporter protein CcmB [Planctomycetes bacterium]|nr:heme exporter protein CcmB [Planctomycetota bacterium]